MKAVAIAAGIVAFLLLYAVARALDEASESEWRAPVRQDTAGITP